MYRLTVQCAGSGSGVANMLFAYASMGGAPGERVKGMQDARAEFISAPMGMVNEMISSMQGGAPPLSTRCYTSFWAWAR